MILEAAILAPCVGAVVGEAAAQPVEEFLKLRVVRAHVLDKPPVDIPRPCGGEALAAILGNQVTVGISGVGEFLPQVEAGTMRILAVSTADKWAGTDAPTLMESGYDVNVQNWRMVAAAPGLSDEQKAAVTADIDKMVNSAGWKTLLETKGWANTYLSGADFDAQLAKEIEATTAVLKDIGLVK